MARRSLQFDDPDSIPLVSPQGFDSFHEKTPPTPFWRSRRLILVVLLLTANLVCYADRTNISVAILFIAEDTHLTSSEKGWVLSSFFCGYLLTQILGGKLAHMYGGRPVLIFAVSAWSIFTLLTPPASRWPLPVLIAVRIFMGMGEGMSLPTIHHLISRWIPLDERTRCVAFITSGQMLGTLLALATSPLVALSWQAVFYAFGLLGLLWSVVAYFFLFSEPQDDPSITARESKYILTSRRDKVQECGRSSNIGFDPDAFKRVSSATYKFRRKGAYIVVNDEDSLIMTGIEPLTNEEEGNEDALEEEWEGEEANEEGSKQRQHTFGDDEEYDTSNDNNEKDSDDDKEDSLNNTLDDRDEVAITFSPGVIALPSFCRLLVHRPFAAIWIGHVCHNWGWYLMLSWGPSYFKYLGTSKSTAGLLMLIPYTAMFCADNLWARHVDGKIGNHTWTVLSARRISQMVAFLAPSVAITLLIVFPSSIALSVLLLTVAIGLASFVHSGLWANIIDIAGPHAGFLLGVSNTLATLPGIGANALAGVLLEDDSWNLLFGTILFAYVVGAIFFWSWAQGTVAFR
eukprot:m.102330 g.102330  ORF g.102330 m.102330 type:complete len:572 (+) comp22335_c0_seq2:36-1751(+)